MGDRWTLEITCSNCGMRDEDVWYAPSCGVTGWACPECQCVVDLEQYTGISREDASNQDEIEAINERVRMAAVKPHENTLWPVAVVDVIQNVMREGELEGKHGWEEHTADYHVERARAHLKQYGRDQEEDHLAHAFTRLMMAVAIQHGYVGGQQKSEEGQP